MLHKNFAKIFVLAAGLQTFPALADAERYHGVDAQQHACAVTVVHDGDQLTDLTIDATFKVTYTVPMPGSGLFGDYYWPGHFSLANNAATGQTVRPRFGGAGLVVTGEGKPIFYDTPTIKHQIVTSGDPANLSELSYSSRDGLLVLFALDCGALVHD